MWTRKIILSEEFAALNKIKLTKLQYMYTIEYVSLHVDFWFVPVRPATCMFSNYMYRKIRGYDVIYARVYFKTLKSIKGVRTSPRFIR